MKRLRYADLKRLGIIPNRTTLSNWVRDRDFPVGQMTGPNSRTWGEDEFSNGWTVGQLHPGHVHPMSHHGAADLWPRDR